MLTALAGNHLLLGAAGMCPRSTLLGPNIVRLPDASRRRGEVALTFDDGPDPEVTPRVLDLLDRYQARASFFCVGARVAAQPGIVREILRRGHSVENHTDRHPYGFAWFPPGRMRHEIAGAQQAIIDAVGVPPRFFRAPVGIRSPLLDPVLASLKLRSVTWTRRGHDGLRRDPRPVLRRLSRGLAAGDLLLLHDGSCVRSQGREPVVLSVLAALLDQIRSRGLRSVSLTTAFADVDR